MSKIDRLLEGGEFKVKTIGQPKDGGIINKILITATIAFGVGGAGLYVYNHTDRDVAENNAVVSHANNNVNNTVTVNNPTVVSAVKEIINAPQTKETSFPINESSSLVTKENKDILNAIGNFSLPEKLADNQIARKVAQIQFSTQNYFTSLVSEGEGFRSHVYDDNIGSAWGNGWNLSMQSKKYNEDLAKAVSIKSEIVQKIVMLSGKVGQNSKSPEFNNALIQPQRSMQVAALMGERFETGVINGIAQHLPKNANAVKIHKQNNESYKQIAQQLYSSLAPNEKAAVLYHSYKVGEAGFSKYNGMIGSLIEYAFSKDKTMEMKKNVADKFTYKYKMNGQVLEDTRASVLVGGMFADTTAFGYLIGKNVAPHNMSSLTSAFNRNKIDGLAKPGEQVIPDSFGDAKAKMEAEGKRMDIMLLPEKDPADNIKSMKNKTKNVPLPFGIMG